MHHWAVKDRITGRIATRHTYHDDAEKCARGDRYAIVPINQDKEDPGLYRLNPARALRAIPSAKRAEQSRVNGAKGGRGRLSIITVTADDGQEQTFRRDQLGLTEDRGYTRAEWREALGAAGYSTAGIVSID